MVICDSKGVDGMRSCVSLPCLLVSFAGVKELLWDKGGHFALIIGGIDDRKNFYFLSVTECLLRPLKNCWK